MFCSVDSIYLRLPGLAGVRAFFAAGAGVAAISSFTFDAAVGSGATFVVAVTFTALSGVAVISDKTADGVAAAATTVEVFNTAAAVLLMWFSFMGVFRGDTAAAV